jgi:molecular chaperone HtpG
MQKLFQVNLRGIIELLSNHLYSGPQVFVRELLQNAVDALTARAKLEGGAGADRGIRVSLRRGELPELVFEDDGIGLTEDEVHQFLATLGESSKRRLGGEPDPDLLGQFGIGLLACFLVTDEIVVHTRSARAADASCIEWRGHQDGTYDVSVIDDPGMSVGTRVTLRARPDRAEWYETAKVRELIEYFGALLGVPVTLSDRTTEARLNIGSAPWKVQHASRTELDKAVLAYGRELFNIEFLDWIPLHSGPSGTDGVAYVLPFAPSLAEPRRHRVYLKGMLVSDESTDIVPPWVFFVNCVVNAEKLRPTASREDLYDDELLASTREDLGNAIRIWLIHMAKSDPDRLTSLIGVHHRALKALAAEDDDVLAVFAEFLPFDTTIGTLAFSELRGQCEVIEYAPTLDAFRQMAPVATAQGKLLVNTGYAYDTDVLTRAAALFEVTCQPLDSTTLTEELDDLSLHDQEETRAFVETAEKALRRFGVDVTIKDFRPEELPAFFAATRDIEFRREIERTRAKTQGIWSDVLGSIQTTTPGGERPILCFNHRHPLVRRLTAVHDEEAVVRAAELLYIHALLLGHRPLRPIEHQLLGTAILGFIEWGLSTRSRVMLQ